MTDALLGLLKSALLPGIGLLLLAPFVIAAVEFDVVAAVVVVAVGFVLQRSWASVVTPCPAMAAVRWAFLQRGEKLGSAWVFSGKK